MKRRLNLEAFMWSSVLFLLLYIFLRMIYNGDIRNFIHPKMVKYTVFAVIAMSVMLAYNLLRLFTLEERGELKYGYILFLIPVVVYMFLKPSGLSESTALSRGINLMFYKALNIDEEHHDHNHTHSHGDGSMLIENNSIILNNDNFFTSLKEIYGHLEEYKDKTVVITGFTVKEKNTRDSFVLSRMIVSCCAADTEVIGIRCVYNYSKALKAGQWVEVKGKFKRDDVSAPPVFVVEKVKVIDKPEESYIYRD